MLSSALFSDLAARLFGTARGNSAAVDADTVSLAVESIIDAIDPRLRTVSKYTKRMTPAVTRAVEHLRELGRKLPAPISLSRAAWANDVFLNTTFATADELSSVLGGSQELRDFFAASKNVSSAQVCALLGMRMSERDVFAPAIVDGQLRQDVAQTTVSFSHHAVLCPAQDIDACRREVGVRILRRMAVLVLERITALDRRATELEQRKAMLGVRLRMLELRQNGLEQVARDVDDANGEMTRLERELKATTDEYWDTKAYLATLDTRIQHIEAIFGAPAEYVRLEQVPLRVNRLGYKISADSSEPASVLTLHELSIGDGLKIVIAFVACNATDIPPRESFAERGARELV